MNIVHLQLSGGIGGISILTRDMSLISKHNNIFYFLFEGGAIADEIAQRSTVHIENGEHFKFLSEAKKFTAFCKKNNADVIIAHTGSPIVRYIATYAKKHIKGVKFLLYWHSNASGDYKSGIKNFVNNAIEKNAFKNCDKAVAISNSVKQSHIKAYNLQNQADKIKVVYNGINCDKFYSNTLGSSNKDVFKIIYVGRVFYSKGIHVLIDAISKLPSDINISVKIVGNDHDGYTEKMKEKATSLGLDDKIEFTGVRLDVPELLADADIFIHPAVCEEGFGITLAEAMASYLPCIAFKRGAIPEIIDNGENGFVIDRISADLLAKTIEDAYNLFKTDDYDQYKINARKKAEFFSVENALCQLEGIYYE